MVNVKGDIGMLLRLSLFSWLICITAVIASVESEIWTVMLSYWGG